MKKLLITGSIALFSVLSIVAQTGANTESKSIDNTASGYSNAGAIGLIILLLIVVALIIAFTWRKKQQQ